MHQILVHLKTINYFRDAVLNELNTLTGIPTSVIETGGLKIYTTLNNEAQTYMENAIKENMKDSSMQVASIIINLSNSFPIYIITIFCIDVQP